MKKKLRKLALSRETLHGLTESRLDVIAGGAVSGNAMCFSAMLTCTEAPPCAPTSPPPPDIPAPKPPAGS